MGRYLDRGTYAGTRDMFYSPAIVYRVVATAYCIPYATPEQKLWVDSIQINK